MKRYERVDNVLKQVEGMESIAYKQLYDTWVEKYPDGSYILDCQTERGRGIFYVYVSPTGRRKGIGANDFKVEIADKIKEFEEKLARGEVNLRV